MSAKDRAEKAARQREQAFVAGAMEGLRQALNSPDGRAFVWWLYSENAEAEGDDSAHGRRSVAREVVKAARLADFDALQIMREEWEKPVLGTRAEAEGEDDVEGDR